MKLIPFLKFYLAIIAIFLCCLSNAQKSNATYNLCERMYPTSIKQVADVKPSDIYFKGLQNVIERYGIDFIVEKNTAKFYSNATFTNAMWVDVLNRSLERIYDLMESIFDEQYGYDRKLTEKEADSVMIIKLGFKSNWRFETYNHKYETVKQIVDVKETDCFYEATTFLLERWHIDFTNKEGLMHATDPINAWDVQRIIQQVFSYPNFDISKYTKGKMTKGEAAMMMSDVLDQYCTMLNNYGKETAANETTTVTKTKKDIDLDELFPTENTKQNNTASPQNNKTDTLNYDDLFTETKSTNTNLLDNALSKKASTKKIISDKNIPNLQKDILKLLEYCTSGFNGLKNGEQSKQADLTFYHTNPNLNMVANNEYIVERNNKTSYCAYYNDVDNKKISWKAFLALPSKIKNAVAYVKINDGYSTDEYTRHDLIINSKAVASYLEYKKDNYNSIQVYQNGY